MFNPQACYLSIWCGRNQKPNNYRRIGHPYECLKKGVGIGKAIKSRGDVQGASLDSIPYITDERKARLHRLQITSVFTLLTHIHNLPDYNSTKRFLEEYLTLTGVDEFNRFILYLYDKGIPSIKLPQCK